MSKPDLRQLCEEKILVMDGAMGTMIQQYELEEKDFRNENLKDHPCPLQGNNDLLSVVRPDIIAAIHAAYFDAGADIVETNTFSGTTIAQADYECEHLVDDINIRSAEIAKKVADEYTAKNPDKPRYVAGAIGPTNKTASLSPDVNNPGYRAITFNELKEAYKQQAIGLIKGGVDCLLVETIFDTLNAKAALFAVQEAYDELNVSLPILVSGTITDASGRTLSGQTTEAFLISVSNHPILSIGLNCALGAKDMKPYLKTLSEKSHTFVSAYPNAGLPNELGEYDETPEQMAAQIEDFLQDGILNIVGGCCGTTPDHIEAIAQAAAKYAPRKTVQEELENE